MIYYEYGQQFAPVKHNGYKGGVCNMDVFEKFGESVYMAGMQVKNKARFLPVMKSSARIISQSARLITKSIRTPRMRNLPSSVLL